MTHKLCRSSAQMIVTRRGVTAGMVLTRNDPTALVCCPYLTRYFGLCTIQSCCEVLQARIRLWFMLKNRHWISYPFDTSISLRFCPIMCFCTALIFSNNNWFMDLILDDLHDFCPFKIVNKQNLSTAKSFKAKSRRCIHLLIV